MGTWAFELVFKLCVTIEDLVPEWSFLREKKLLQPYYYENDSKKIVGTKEDGPGG